MDAITSTETTPTNTYVPRTAAWPPDHSDYSWLLLLVIGLGIIASQVRHALTDRGSGKPDRPGQASEL